MVHQTMNLVKFEVLVHFLCHYSTTPEFLGGSFNSNGLIDIL